MRVAVAMSGGVDSSVAAHILKARGHDVFGLTMKTWPCGNDAEVDPRVCCGPAAARDAERVAHELGIRHYTIGLERRFEEAIVEHFVAEYARGRTPNPCARCNSLVKFGALLPAALSLGADRLATGHHAVVQEDPSTGTFALLRSRDRLKDQTYFLYALTQRQLSRALMPVGELRKEKVRAIARTARLHVAERPESQDVCFIPRGDVAAFLRERCPSAVRPGPIIDRDGAVLGEHRGIGLYTVGQRSGLGLSRSRPSYVLRIAADENAVVVGDERDLMSQALVATDLSWIAGSPPGDAFRAAAKIRYAATPAPCTVTVGADESTVSFDEPQRALAPGQAVVLYAGDAVLGGGTIVRRAVLPAARGR
jgi:tRNA-specific 2-thiouridylase